MFKMKLFSILFLVIVCIVHGAKREDGIKCKRPGHKKGGLNKDVYTFTHINDYFNLTTREEGRTKLIIGRWIGPNFDKIIGRNNEQLRNEDNWGPHMTMKTRGSTSDEFTVKAVLNDTIVVRDPDGSFIDEFIFDGGLPFTVDIGVLTRRSNPKICFMKGEE